MIGESKLTTNMQWTLIYTQEYPVALSTDILNVNHNILMIHSLFYIPLKQYLMRWQYRIKTQESIVENGMGL